MLHMAGAVPERRPIATVRSADGGAMLLTPVGVAGARVHRALVAGAVAAVVVDGPAEAVAADLDGSEHVSRVAIEESHSLEDQECFF